MNELEARLQSGGGWGEVSSENMGRYMLPTKQRRKCSCGCGKNATHSGFANGLALMSGCEMYVRRWVRSPEDARRPRAEWSAQAPEVKVLLRAEFPSGWRWTVVHRVGFNAPTIRRGRADDSAAAMIAAAFAVAAMEDKP